MIVEKFHNELCLINEGIFDCGSLAAFDFDLCWLSVGRKLY